MKSKFNDNTFMKLVDAISKLPSILKYGGVIVLGIVLIVLRGISLPENILWFVGIITLACLFTFAFVDVFKFVNRKRRGLESSTITIYVTVHKEGDKTSYIPNAEVRLSLPEPLIRHTDTNGTVVFASIISKHAGHKFAINASKEGYKVRSPQDCLITDGVSIPLSLELIDEPINTISPLKENGKEEISESTPINNRIVFDESHGQSLWWTIPPTLDQGFKRLGELTAKYFQCASLAGNKKISLEQLTSSKVLILAVGPQGKTQLGQEEIDAINHFVRNGGGLVVLSTYTGDWHHEANLNRLIGYYGIAFNRDVVLPEGSEQQDGLGQSSQYSPDAKSVVVARPTQISPSSTNITTWSKLTQDVGQVLTLSSCSLFIEEAKAIPLLESDKMSIIQEPIPIGVGIHIDKYLIKGNGPAILLAASRFSKVVVSGSYKMFLNDFIDHPSINNRKLWENILKWLAD